MVNRDEKRKSDVRDLPAVQESNQKWWTQHTMSYDWNEKLGIEKFTDAWFDEVDRRFVHGARLFAHDHTPFDRVIPFKELNGKRVLEIGCGMGYHSELLVRAGAKLTSVDISETSVNATRRRFELRALSADIMRMDAAQLDFPDGSFDFVWSWGVIHHSAYTAKIIREMSRVLRDRGQVRLMVYNLNGMSAYVAMMFSYLLGVWRGKSLDECLWSKTDGYMARYYSDDVLSDFMSVFFSEVQAQTFGQDVDAVPLPRRLRNFVMSFMSDRRIAELANRRGGFLFMTAIK